MTSIPTHRVETETGIPKHHLRDVLFTRLTTGTNVYRVVRHDSYAFPKGVDHYKGVGGETFKIGEGLTEEHARKLIEFHKQFMS